MAKLIFEYQEKQANLFSETRSGILELLTTKPPYEAIVEAEGTAFNFIYGKYQHGYYFTIPERNVGCPMAKYKDIKENSERLHGTGLEPNEAHAAVIALSHLKKALDLSLKEDQVLKTKGTLR